MHQLYKNINKLIRMKFVLITVDINFSSINKSYKTKY